MLKKIPSLFQLTARFLTDGQFRDLCRTDIDKLFLDAVFEARKRVIISQSYDISIGITEHNKHRKIHQVNQNIFDSYLNENQRLDSNYYNSYREFCGLRIHKIYTYMPSIIFISTFVAFFISRFISFTTSSCEYLSMGSAIFSNLFIFTHNVITIELAKNYPEKREKIVILSFIPIFAMYIVVYLSVPLHDFASVISMSLIRGIFTKFFQ